LVNAQFIEIAVKDFDISPDDVDRISDLNKKFVALIKVKFDVLEKKFLNLYSEFLTEEDVDALIETHETPIAKKMMLISKDIGPRAGKIGQEFGEDLMRQLTNQFKIVN